jgi:hypothetical protein
LIKDRFDHPWRRSGGRAGALIRVELGESSRRPERAYRRSANRSTTPATSGATSTKSERNAEDRSINLYNIRADRLISDAPVKGQCACHYWYGDDGQLEAAGSKACSVSRALAS